MLEEFGECYPLHLGVTEAGDGEDGRIKSAIGIGTLLEDGIGDTIRVSLTEDPEFEIPVCKDMVKRFQPARVHDGIPAITKLPYSPFSYQRRATYAVDNIGGSQVPVVIADLSRVELQPAQLKAVGYNYDAATDKWSIADAAADYLFTANKQVPFDLPGTVKVIVYPQTWLDANDPTKYFPLFDIHGYRDAAQKSDRLNFVMVDCFNDSTPINDFTGLEDVANDPTVVLCLSSTSPQPMPAVRRMMMELMARGIQNPVVLMTDSPFQTPDEHLIHLATETGALLLDGMGDGIALGMTTDAYAQTQSARVSGRTYLTSDSVEQFLNNTAFSILQATRTRISKTEYISCPSCGRTLFDLQETTAKIRSVTHHLKGVKIAIMGCIVNGPGEMADADFGYVGSGVGKITLYKGKEVVKKNIDSAVAVEELIDLLKTHGAWVDPPVTVGAH